MSISEADRQELYNDLVRTIGPKSSDTLMSVMPFYTLDEVATKGDIAVLDARIQGLDVRLTNVERELRSIRKWMMATLMTLVVSQAGVILAMVQLSR